LKILGGLGLFWTVIFFALTSNTPATHRFISKGESVYILEATKKSIETREALQSVNLFTYSRIYIIIRELDKIKSLFN
jgi:hypothetical protein